MVKPIQGFIVVIAAVALGATAFGAYQYVENKSLETRLSYTQEEIGVVAQSVADSKTASAQVQEIANRTQVEAKAEAPSLTSAVAKVVPAVVSVVISEEVPQLQVQYVNPFGNDPNFRNFGVRIPVYQQVGTESQQIGGATGFFIRSDGYILTNRHVIIDPSATYTVLLSDGSQKPASVYYVDPNNDIAILKVAGTGYPTVSLGDSSTLELGQTIAAIGNALAEYNNSVSTGIISGLNRTVDASDDNGNVEELTGTIQTDAAINPGNSGGPLLDLNGSVVGVNVATVAGSNNISFAIPINSVKSIINKVL